MIQPKILTKAEKKDIKRHQCKFLSHGSEPISFFSSERMVEYQTGLAKTLLKGRDISLLEIHNSDRTLKRAAEDESERLIQYFKDNSKELADNSRLCIVLDHQTPPKSSSESARGSSRLGVGLLVRNDKFERNLFLLDYYPVPSGSVANNEERLEEIMKVLIKLLSLISFLQKFGLEELLLTIPIIGDLHARKLCSTLNAIFVTSCSAHHLRYLSLFDYNNYLRKIAICSSIC